MIARLSSGFGAQPSEEEIAQEMALPLRRYRSLLQAAQDGVVSLDGAGHDDEPPLQLMTPTHEVTERCALYSQLGDAIKRLPTSDCSVMMALKAGESAREIADRLHVTEGRISQIKNRAIRRLRIELAVTGGTS